MESTLFCCVVLDAYSRKAVGWAIDRRVDASLINSALDVAAGSRNPCRPLIMHADHGVQFTSWAFTRNVARYKLNMPMGTVGDCYDNAMIETPGGVCKRNSSTANHREPTSNPSGSLLGWR